MVDSFETKAEFCVVTEFAQGELFEILEDDKCLPEDEVCAILRQAARPSPPLPSLQPHHPPRHEAAKHPHRQQARRQALRLWVRQGHVQQHHGAHQHQGTPLYMGARSSSRNSRTTTPSTCGPWASSSTSSSSANRRSTPTPSTPSSRRSSATPSCGRRTCPRSSGPSSRVCSTSDRARDWRGRTSWTTRSCETPRTTEAEAEVEVEVEEVEEVEAEEREGAVTRRAARRTPGRRLRKNRRRAKSPPEHPSNSEIHPRRSARAPLRHFGSSRVHPRGPPRSPRGPERAAQAPRRVKAPARFRRRDGVFEKKTEPACGALYVWSPGSGANDRYNASGNDGQKGGNPGPTI